MRKLTAHDDDGPAAGITRTIKRSITVRHASPKRRDVSIITQFRGDLLGQVLVHLNLHLRIQESVEIELHGTQRIVGDSEIVEVEEVVVYAGPPRAPSRSTHEEFIQAI